MVYIIVSTFQLHCALPPAPRLRGIVELNIVIFFITNAIPPHFCNTKIENRGLLLFTLDHIWKGTIAVSTLNFERVPPKAGTEWRVPIYHYAERIVSD